MNFPHFGGHFPTNLPTLHQFAAKFSQENVTNTLCATQDNSRYTANGIPSVTQHHPATQQQLLNAGKYHGSYINNHSYIQHGNSIHGNNSTNGPNIRITEKKQLLNYDQQELTQELCAVILQQQQNVQEKLNEVVEKTNNKETHHQNTTAALRPQQSLQETLNVINTAATAPSTSSWQTALTSGSSVADYLSHLPTSTLPLSLQHFLKFSADSLKKESNNGSNLNQNSNVILQTAQNNVSTVNLNSILSNNNNSSSNNVQNTVNNHQSSVGLSSLSTINTAQLHSHTNPNGNTVVKKKKKKKVEKEKKPRPKPGEIRLTTALDGSTLYCCPECHMAYPEKELLEQHLVGHTMERRFVCDICGAGLKRKDHLTRHKQSHNPERPFVCTVCLKAFKRKEQLTLHFVIHSGEKRHICTECGKGFYRKDHLRKHTRSHIARRVKAELSQQGSNNGVGLGLQNNGSATSSGEVGNNHNSLQLG